MTHEEIKASALSARDCYRVLTDLVTPRPIAWVSTQNGDGVRNLAPFSYYQAVCSRPPTVMISAGWNADGRPKDTLANILETGELVINHVSQAQAEAMNATSGAHPPEVSEWDVVGVESLPSTEVAPPRVAGAHAAMECRLKHAIPIGVTPAGTPSSTVVLAEVVTFHVREGYVQRLDNGRLRPIPPGDLDGVGRMGGMAYTRTTDTFELDRPVVAKPKTESKTP